MANTIQVRRDSAADWTSNDPTLAEGELGYETDTGFLKIGDGSTSWTSLIYTITSIQILQPSGSITAFAGSSAPDGWLECDGSAVSRSTYSRLYTAVGDNWGEGDGSTTFNLPDLRGKFLRGYDHGATNDPNAASRTAQTTGGNTGDNVGSVQADATAKNGLSNASSSLTSGSISGTAASSTHSHDLPGYTGTPGGSTYYYKFVGGDDTFGATSTGAGGGHIHSVSGSCSGTCAAQTISGDDETRPINASVMYIIKT